MSNSTPAYIAYTVRKTDDKDNKGIWTRIGAAWPHRDAKGIDLVLEAFPVDGKVVLRVNEPRETEAAPPAARPAKPYPKKRAYPPSERISAPRPTGPTWKRR